LAADPGFRDRRRTWHSVPERVDGTGSTAASLADELVAGLEASVAPLRARHEREMAELEARNMRASEVNGRKGGRGGAKAGVAELEERQRRELRRQRTDELRAGLAVLAGAYRDRLTDPRRAEETLRALERVHATAVALQYNPGELLLLQGLLARLSQAATGNGEAKSRSQ
ncbi:MAG: hypothetical protein J2P57_08915, partial [Acidimicrobiaceae bacterium]|nr:hypothetical protein [Acidimicrobiaceae bacterium]